MTEGRHTDHTAERADNGGDRAARHQSDTVQEGALNRMQAEALPQVGQRSGNPGANVSAEAGAGKGDKPSSLPNLELFDGAAEGGDKERGVKPGKGGGAHSDKAPAAKTEKSATDGTAGAKGESPKSDFVALQEVGRSHDFDPKKPTAAVIDIFDKNEQSLSANTVVPHGQISALAAEKNGFNTISLQFKDDNPAGATDFSKHFNQVADGIDKGTMPLGKGDVVNISMGNADPTFDQASKFLGFPVNADNLASEKGHILQKMGEIAKDPSRSKDDQETAARVVRTNEAIDRVQSKGVEVVQAAGNFGKDQFSWDFMNAKTQLSSYKPSGDADAFSANHSLATKSDGVFPIKHSNEMNMLDPTRLRDQKGTLEIGDTGVKFPEGKGKPFSGNDRIYDREKQDFNTPMPRATAESLPHATSAELNPHLTLTNKPYPARQLGDTTTPSASAFTKSGPQPKFETVRPATERSNSRLSAPADGQERAAGNIAGTSFADINYLKQNHDRLAREKAGQ